MKMLAQVFLVAFLLHSTSADGEMKPVSEIPEVEHKNSIVNSFLDTSAADDEVKPVSEIPEVETRNSFVDAHYASDGEIKPIMALNDQVDRKRPGFYNLADADELMEFQLTLNDSLKNEKYMQFTDCLCGRENGGNRILGGTQVPNQGYYPWVVKLSTGCSGTLVSDRWVVTAAHCITSLSAASQLLMTFREHTLDSPFDPAEFRVSAAAVLYYSGLYDSATFNYDFALVQLALPVPITGLSNIRPVCLASQSFDFNGYTGIPIGWGVYENGVGRQASVLRETTVSICNRAACLNSGGVPSSTSICGFTRGRGICFGDSGGPMTVKSAGKHYFAGFPVATHPGTAPNTCDTNKPQYYTQATFFTNVITQYAWVFGNYCSY